MSNGSGSSSSNSNNLQYKNTILSNGAIVVEVDGIEDTDTSFQVEGMPFLRIVTEPEYWTTPHVKNSKLKQDRKKITIPIQWYLNPSYQDKATKEQKEKKFKQLESQYDQMKN